MSTLSVGSEQRNAYRLTLRPCGGVCAYGRGARATKQNRQNQQRHHQRYRSTAVQHSLTLPMPHAPVFRRQVSGGTETTPKGARGTGSTILLVTEEVLHPIGKNQLLLIGWNLPDQVESCRRCKHASTMKDDRTHATANPTDARD